MDKKLANTMLGETVIYMDDDMQQHAAMIIDIMSSTVVSLQVTRRDGTTTIERSVEYSNSDAKDRWWRRNKF